MSHPSNNDGVTSRRAALSLKRKQEQEKESKQNIRKEKGKNKENDQFYVVDDRSDEVNSAGLINNDFCYSCRDGGDLLCCENCELSFHLLCLNPPNPEVPEGDWFCRKCSFKMKSKSKRNFGHSLFSSLFESLAATNPEQFELPRDYFSGNKRRKNAKCNICDSNDNPEELLECHISKCTNASHTYCLEPPLIEVPMKWGCHLHPREPQKQNHYNLLNRHQQYQHNISYTPGYSSGDSNNNDSYYNYNKRNISSPFLSDKFTLDFTPGAKLTFKNKYKPTYKDPFYENIYANNLSIKDYYDHQLLEDLFGKDNSNILNGGSREQNRITNDKDNLNRLEQLLSEQRRLSVASMPSEFGLFPTDLATNPIDNCNSFVLSSLSPLFTQFLAWQRLMQINGQIFQIRADNVHHLNQQELQKQQQHYMNNSLYEKNRDIEERINILQKHREEISNVNRRHIESERLNGDSNNNNTHNKYSSHSNANYETNTLNGNTNSHKRKKTSSPINSNATTTTTTNRNTSPPNLSKKATPDIEPIYINILDNSMETDNRNHKNTQNQHHHHQIKTTTTSSTPLTSNSNTKKLNLKLKIPSSSTSPLTKQSPSKNLLPITSSTAINNISPDILLSDVPSVTYPYPIAEVTIKETNQVFKITKSNTIIGRLTKKHEDIDINIPSKVVSRYHTFLSYIETIRVFKLTNIGRNKIYIINGSKIDLTNPYRLNDEDVVMIGEFTLKFKSLVGPSLIP